MFGHHEYFPGGLNERPVSGEKKKRLEEQCARAAGFRQKDYGSLFFFRSPR